MVCGCKSDSAAFQVYNNIKESESTTIAIRETQGQIAMIGENLAETYYYSTSCGFEPLQNHFHPYS